MAEKAFEPTGLMGPQIFGLPVDRETLFSNHKKIYKKRIENRQRKLIVKLPFLKPFLKKGEKILLVSTGYSPITSLAQYATGFSEAISVCIYQSPHFSCARNAELPI
jgi:hypothetical protein